MGWFFMGSTILSSLAIIYWTSQEPSLLMGGENNAWMSIQLLSHKLVSTTWSLELAVRNQLKSDMW